MTAPALSIATPNGRYYTHHSRRSQVPSITNVIGKKDKPGLKFWAAREAANYAADNREKLATLARDEAFTLVKGAPFQRREDSPSAIGDIVHDWIDRYVKSGGAAAVYTPEEWQAAPVTARNMWGSFGRFVEHYRALYGLEFLDSEFTVWSDKHDYAGTGDLALKIGRMHVLVDTKTGKDVYPETAMQLAALANADVILHPEHGERPVPKFDRYGVLHIRPMSFTLVPVDHVDEAWQAFLGLRRLFEWEVQYGDKTLGFAPKVSTRSTGAQAAA